jgi:hypothetical protein
MHGFYLIITTSMITLANVCNYIIVLFLLCIVSLILCFFVVIVLSFGGHLTIHLTRFCFIKCPTISTTFILYICLFLIPITTNIRPFVVAFVEDIVEFICGNFNATPFCLVWFIHLYRYEICSFF